MEISKLRPILDDQGEPLKEGGKFTTLGDLISSAVLTPIRGEDDGKTKYAKWEIHKKLLKSADMVTFTSEEIVIIEKASAANHPPLLYGQLYDYLEDKQ